MQIQDRPEFKSKSAVMTFAPDDLVIDAVRAMSERNYGAVVIVDPDRRPVGIVSERDFMRRLLNRSLDPNATRLEEIMTRELKMAQKDDELLGWLQQMSNERFRHLPVVDDEGRLINIMSQGDFVSYTWPQLISRIGEQARATFDVNPSIYLALGGAVIFMLIVLTAVVLAIG
jgi:CBS domain-containing protein